MALAAGRLRHRVLIQEQVGTQDSNGDQIVVWADVATVWAAVEPLSVREFIAAQATQSQVSARVVIRYRDDLTAAMRLVHRGKILNPEGWLPDPEMGLEYLTAPCSSGVDEGI